MTNAKRPKKGQTNFYEKFDFFFTRTTFRTMAQYFKQAYNPYFELCAGVKKLPTGLTVDESLVLYCQKELPGVLECFKTEFERIEFLELLKLLVLAHRHNRNDEFLANPRVPFDTVREPMYKYSRGAQ